MFKVTYHSVEIPYLENTERELNSLHKTWLLRHMQSTNEGKGIVCVWYTSPEGEAVHVPLGYQLI